MRSLITFLAASLAMAARAEDVDPAERLYIAGISLVGEPAVRYEREAIRLEDLCRPSSGVPQDERDRAICIEKYVDRSADRIATLHSAPDAQSPIVGFVWGVLRAGAWNVGYDLEIELAADPSRRRVWIENAGEWMHGVDQPGVRVRGSWVQLIGPSFPPISWIDVKEAKLPIDVTSIGGSLVSLPALSATFPDGEQRAIAEGAYRIERIADGIVTFRAEIPSDMPCGGPDEPPPDPPAVMPPMLRAPARHFFGADGVALFRDAYPGGCC